MRGRDVFEMMGRGRHEQLSFWSEPEAGYQGIIAIHDTARGPALGGTRFWRYADSAAAMTDALRLSRGMTYKAAVAGVALGGGKSVILDSGARPVNREALFRAHGRAVESLGGRYITSEDVGTSVDDMEHVRQETRHVVGLKDRSGDPSPVTAYGVFQGVRASVLKRYGKGSLGGLRVSVQGLGNVGRHLARYLHDEGAQLTVTDIDPDRIARVQREMPGCAVVAPDEIYAVEGEVFAPCALGAVVNDETLKTLRVGVIAGAANNQLAEPRHGVELHRKGILYAPDYVVNAGGLVNVYGELRGWDESRSRAQTERIYDTLIDVFELAEELGIATSKAADRIAQARLEESRSSGARVGA